MKAFILLALIVAMGLFTFGCCCAMTDFTEDYGYYDDYDDDYYYYESEATPPQS